MSKAKTYTRKSIFPWSYVLSDEAQSKFKNALLFKCLWTLYVYVHSDAVSVWSSVIKVIKAYFFCPKQIYVEICLQLRVVQKWRHRQFFSSPHRHAFLGILLWCCRHRILETSSYVRDVIYGWPLIYPVGQGLELYLVGWCSHKFHAWLSQFEDSMECENLKK